MTVQQYEELLAFQGGVCYICGRPPAPGKHLHLDHDHAYAKEHCDHPHQESCSWCWRGLVHRHDNDVLATGRDSIDYFQRVIDYLRKSPAQQLFRARPQGS